MKKDLGYGRLRLYDLAEHALGRRKMAWRSGDTGMFGAWWRKNCSVVIY